MRFDENVGRWLAELGLKVVAVGGGLLQGGVRDLGLFGGIGGRLEKVGDEEDLQDTDEEEEQREADIVWLFVVSNVPHSSSFFQTPSRWTWNIFISVSVSAQLRSGGFKLHSRKSTSSQDT